MDQTANEAYDRAVFERVWQRVMPQVREDCPIAVNPPPTAAIPPLPEADFPDGTDVPCLGSEAMMCCDLLQELIREELQDWQFYRMLARRAGGGVGRIFSGISADEWRHAKRLSAAYFLITGIRYFPEPNGAVPMGSYLGSLRTRFIGEQNGAAAYLSAAEGCRDTCLRTLFLDHAKEEQGHARLIRGVVEQL